MPPRSLLYLQIVGAPCLTLFSVARGFHRLHLVLLRGYGLNALLLHNSVSRAFLVFARVVAMHPHALSITLVYIFILFVVLGPHCMHAPPLAHGM